MDKNALTQRRAQLKSKYGLSLQRYAEMFDAQGGVCAICHKPQRGKSKQGRDYSLSVDHDHACCPGEKSCGDCVRGLLCIYCNGFISHLEGETTLLDNAVVYLSSHS